MLAFRPHHQKSHPMPQPPPPSDAPAPPQAEPIPAWQAAFDALRAITSADPVEDALAAQCHATHAAAMECLAQAMRHGLGEDRRIRLRSDAVAMMRGFTLTLRALQRHRRVTGAESAAGSPVRKSVRSNPMPREDRPATPPAR